MKTKMIPKRRLHPVCIIKWLFYFFINALYVSSSLIYSVSLPHSETFIEVRKLFLTLRFLVSPLNLLSKFYIVISSDFSEFSDLSSFFDLGDSKIDLPTILSKEATYDNFNHFIFLFVMSVELLFFLL